MPRGMKFLFLFLLGWSLGSSAAYAGRPLFTEDTGTAEKRTFELELALDYLRDDNRDKYFTPIAQLAYGLTERIEIAASVAYIFWDIHDGDREDGWGDINVYFKYRVWDEGKFHPAFAFKPLIKIPTANENKDLGSGKTDYGLTAVFSKSLGSWNIHFDALYLFIGEDHETDVLDAGLAAEYEIKKGLLAVGEIRYANNLNSDDKDDPTFVLFGFQSQAGSAIFDGGMIIGLNNAAPDYGFTLGVTLQFK